MELGKCLFDVLVCCTGTSVYFALMHHNGNFHDYNLMNCPCSVARIKDHTTDQTADRFQYLLAEGFRVLR